MTSLEEIALIGYLIQTQFGHFQSETNKTWYVCEAK